MRKWMPLALVFASTIISTAPFTASANALSVTAASGSAADIQAAVDQVVAAGGIGDVHIPEGTWDFVEVGEDWAGAAVDISAGINIFGAPTQRDADEQVVEWKTVIRLPWDATEGDSWFSFVGDADPNKPSRFSDIKMIGYRSIDPDSTKGHRSIVMKSVANFRIDHCYFENVVYGITASSAPTHSWTPITSYGVIDHCYHVNTHGYPAPYPGTVGYGVAPSRGYGDFWEDDVSKVLGQYNNYTVFIEDCYFEKWRHVVAANSGAHYVFRHNTIKDDFGYGSLDAHGWFQTRCNNPQHGTLTNPPKVYDNASKTWVCGYEVLGNPGDICGEPLGGENFYITQVGTRAVEIYNNTIIDAMQSSWGTMIRGGSGVAFNNIVGGGTYTSFIYFSNEAHPAGSKVWSKDWWVWNNTMLDGCREVIEYDPGGNITEGVSYFLNPPHTFTYVPYPYPHSLTIEPLYKHRLWGTLLDNYGAAMQSQISVYIEDTETVITSSQTDASGDYDMNIQPGVFDIGYRILNPSFYIPNFCLRLRSINVSAPLQNLVKSITSYSADRKVGFTLNVSESQIIQTHSHIKPARVRINGSLLSEVTSLSALKDNTWYYDSAGQRLHMIVSPLVSVIAASGSAADIQAAVDQVVAAGGIGDVHIPAGTFNFVEPGQLLGDHTVDVPAGVNIFGAPTQRTSGIPVPEYGTNPNDQVVSWETVLILPSDDNAPTLPGDDVTNSWFFITGTSDPNEKTRISDIKFVGYRSIDPSSTQQTAALKVEAVMDLRVDHCHFENLAGGALSLKASRDDAGYKGVIDHCRIENPAGGLEAPWGSRTLTYGVSSGRGWWNTVWDPEISNVLGKYNDYSLYIEDNYFSQWRHDISSNHGAHWVARHNTFEFDEGYGTVDCHGGNNPGETGTRASEVYDNAFLNSVDDMINNPGVMFWRGGGGVFTHNYEDGSYESVAGRAADLVWFSTDSTDYPHDVYIWNNTHGCSNTYRVESGAASDVILDADFFARAPSLADDGWEYAPYPYPHPLTLED